MHLFVYNIVYTYRSIDSKKDPQKERRVWRTILIHRKK